MACVIAAAAISVVVAITVSDFKTVPLPHLLTLACLALLCELVPIPGAQDDQEVSLSTPLVLATVALFGIWPTILVAFSAYFTASVIGWSSAVLSEKAAFAEVIRPVGWRRSTFHLARKLLLVTGRTWVGRITGRPFGRIAWTLAYNAAVACVVALSAAATYTVMGGHLFGIAHHFHPVIGWALTIPAALAGLIAYTLIDGLNYSILSLLCDIRSGYTANFRDFLLGARLIMGRYISCARSANLLMGVLAAILVFLFVEMGPPSILPLIGAFYMLRDSMKKTVWQVKTYRETLSTLGTYMQRYHPYTEGHLRRVARLSEQLAREMRMSMKTIALISDAAKLHDIGKIGVSEEILDKTGKLTEEEWEIIRQHPIKGAQIISHLPYLKETVEWIRYHHKWIDGSGYPDDGRKGEAIPLEAAIISVADAFDAMTGGFGAAASYTCDVCGYIDDISKSSTCPRCGALRYRAYRSPMTPEQAVDQLRRGAGTQFSPAVVKAFLQIADRSMCSTKPEALAA